eukprot:scaffold320_cov367-Pinguiococcus_pyrenoidosus.AAC.5
MAAARDIDSAQQRVHDEMRSEVEVWALAEAGKERTRRMRKPPRQSSGTRPAHSLVGSGANFLARHD